MDRSTSGMNAFRGVSTAAILLMLAACATTGVRPMAEELIEEDPFRVANVIHAKRGQEGLVFTSYGRAGGRSERLASNEELAEVWTMESTWGTAAFVAAPDEAADLQQGFADHKDGTSPLFNAFDVAMRSAIDSLPAVSDHGVDLKILLAFPGSGRAIRRQHLVDGTPLEFAFLAHLNQDQNADAENPGAIRWVAMVSTIVHELLHVEHRLQDLRPESINSETAAELFGDCAISRFATAAGANLKLSFDDVSLPDDGFPGLEDGIFAPRVQRFPSRNATLRGQRMKQAWLYHYSSGEPLSFTDPEAVDQMLRLCDQLSRRVPDFANGETGLESMN